MKEGKNITRAIIEATVERGLREVDEDPQRSIRKFVDLGRQFSKGRFTDDIYNIFADLLRNEESPYYTAFEHVMHHTSFTTLKHFGVNIGYNSFTRGGKIIRKIEEKADYHIPWAISIIFDPESENSLTPATLDRLINEGIEYGIFTYNLIILKNISTLSPLLPIVKKHPGCAFFLTLPDDEIDSHTAEVIKDCPNTLSLLAIGEYVDINSLTLRRQKSWYGVYVTYNDSTCDNVLTTSACRKYLASEASFVIALAEKGTSLETIIETQKKIKEFRFMPTSPLFIFDMYGDCYFINKLISGYPCYMIISPNGTIETNNASFTGDSKLSMAELLKKIFPKTETEGKNTEA